MERAARACSTTRALPVYTVLVPLYHEVAVVPPLGRALEELEWPKAKLDVRVLLEEGDRETVPAARAANLPAYVTLIGVPRGAPWSPAHCIRGSAAMVSDLRRRGHPLPEPDQLKRV